MDIGVNYQEGFWLMAVFITGCLVTLRLILKEIDNNDKYGQQEEINRPYDWERDGM